jgi:hypothetical protein
MLHRTTWIIALLLLGLRDNKAGKRHFHFESFWPKTEGFHEAVEEAWQSVQPGPCPVRGERCHVGIAIQMCHKKQ